MSGGKTGVPKLELSSPSAIEVYGAWASSDWSFIVEEEHAGDCEGNEAAAMRAAG